MNKKSFELKIEFLMGLIFSIIVSIEFSIQIRTIQPEAETIQVSYVTDTEDDGSQDDLSELTIQNTSEDEEIQRITFNNDTVHSRRVFFDSGSSFRTKPKPIKPKPIDPNRA